MHSTRTAHRAGGLVQSTQQRRLLEATVQKLLDIQRRIWRQPYQHEDRRDLHEVPPTSPLATRSSTTHGGENSRTTASGRVPKHTRARAASFSCSSDSEQSSSTGGHSEKPIAFARSSLGRRCRQRTPSCPGECRSISPTYLRGTAGQAAGKLTVDGTGDLVRRICGPARRLWVQHLPLSFVPVPAHKEGRARPCTSSTSGEVTVSSGVLGEAQLLRHSRVRWKIPRAHARNVESEARQADLRRATSMISYARPAELRVEARKQTMYHSPSRTRLEVIPLLP
ncbi:hypothetical protein VTO73DRAFT_12307 [Trametes versicolor]